MAFVEDSAPMCGFQTVHPACKLIILDRRRGTSNGILQVKRSNLKHVACVMSVYSKLKLV